MHLKPALQIRNHKFVHSIAGDVERDDAAAACRQTGQGITKTAAPKIS